jgi:hypothetical protein
MNQKAIKALKKEISDETALRVGYFEGTKEAIIKTEPLLLNEVMAGDAGDYLTKLAREGKTAEFDNVFITEAVRLMKYSEFKEAAPQFFTYQKTETEILAEPVEVSRRYLKTLQDNAEQAFKEPTASQEVTLKERLTDLTTMRVPNGHEAVAYDPQKELVAILESPENNTAEPYLDDNLISDYRAGQSENELIVERVFDQLSPTFMYDLAGIEMTGDYDIDTLKEGLVTVFDQQANRSGELDERLIADLNQELSSHEQVLVQHTVTGYGQGEVWSLHYLLDQQRDPEITTQDVRQYLEHEVGAYYRGSYTELQIYDKDNELVDTIAADQEEFWHDPVAQVVRQTGNTNFVDPTLALEQEKTSSQGLKR